MISLDRFKLGPSNLHTGRMYQILAYGWQTTHKTGVIKVIWPIFIFDARNHIYETAKARVAKFCMQVEYRLSMLALGWQTTP